MASDILNNKAVEPATFTQRELVTSESVDKLYPNDRSVNLPRWRVGNSDVEKLR